MKMVLNFGSILSSTARGIMMKVRRPLSGPRAYLGPFTTLTMYWHVCSTYTCFSEMSQILHFDTIHNSSEEALCSTTGTTVCLLAGLTLL